LVDLERALANDLVEVHFQPVLWLPASHIVGFEALARIRDGHRLIGAPRFIPAAERHGLIKPLGAVVLRKALRAAAAWRSGAGPLSTATVSVNAAAAQLEDLSFVQLVRDLLARYQLAGSALILEVTETGATSATARPVLEQISALGVRIALDDFGTGFATLDNLRRLPIQVLKLDRSFVAGVTSAGADRAIVRVTIDLADTLGMSVIAEGVETEEQAQALVRLGCQALQGHLFGAAEPDPDAIAARVAENFPARGGPQLARHEDDPWSLSAEEAVAAAVRLLAAPDDTSRALMHALSTELARLLGWDPVVSRALGRLALVHDLPRLRVDGQLPAALGQVALLRVLDGSPASAEEAGLLAVLDWVRRVAGQFEPDAPVDSLAKAILGADLVLPSDLAGLPVDPSGAFAATFDQAQWSIAQARLAAAPPPLPELPEIIEDLDRRRLGRRGMEDRLRSLIGVTQVLSHSRDARELIRVSLEEVRRIVGAASATLERWERDSSQLRALVNVGELGPGEDVFPVDETYALAEYGQVRRTMLTGLPYIHTIDDPDADPEAIELLRSLHKYSSAAIPVYLEGQIWGQIWLTTQLGDPPFRASDIELLTAVATLMGSVVAQVENLERVARTAFEDPLTRIGNRRALDDALAELHQVGLPAVLALLDVDRMKEINARDGHRVGDETLIQVANVLTKLAVNWPGSVVARLGGDEFCLVAPLAVAAEVRRQVGKAFGRLRSEGGPQVSLGLASSVGGTSPRDLLLAADESLYLVKQAGRDQSERT
jgi:diguanylate cyclase (GGDEF)-like protein